VSYDVTDDVEVYFQFADAFTTTDINSRYNRANLTIRADNAFIPAEVRARMTSLGLASFPMSFYSPDLGKIGSTGRRHFNQYLGGLEGSFDVGDGSWSWNLFGSRSNSRWSMLARNVYNRTKFAGATDAIIGPAGIPVCRVNTDANAANDLPGCVPYNIMGIGVASQAAFDYVMSDRAAAVQYQILDQVSGSVNGEPFSTWAGPVSVALGVEYFVNEAKGFSSPVAEAALFSTANFVSTNGKYNTKEAFAETVVPLATNEAWAQLLEINGGIRVADFSTSGVVWAWKVGMSYSPVSDLRFRATRSRDTRSPLMGELFANGASAGTTINDPTLNRLQYVIDISTTGNLGLAPEKANTLGVGVVYQSSLIQGFAASVDYYQIDIFESIASQGTQATIDRCFEGQQNFCNNIIRGSDGRIQRVFNRPANAGAALSEGWDFEASYRMQMSDVIASADGSLMLRGLATHITKQTSTAPDGSITLNSVSPWNYTLSLTYDRDSFTASWSGRGAGSKKLNANWIECTSGCPAIAPPVYTANDLVVKSRFYQDISFTYHLEPMGSFSSDIFLTIDNIANLAPDPKANVVGGNLSDVGNPLGRIFKGGVRFRM
jgi:iron complex outermembrane recepter protein